MRIIIPIIIFFAILYRHWKMMVSGNPVSSAARREKRAIAHGDVTTATRRKSRRTGAASSRTGNTIWRCEYEYYVDGQRYYFKYSTHSAPPEQLKICFDRNRNCEYIDRSKITIGDRIVMWSPVYCAIAAYLILRVLGL